MGLSPPEEPLNRNHPVKKDPAELPLLLLLSRNFWIYQLLVLDRFLHFSSEYSRGREKFLPLFAATSQPTLAHQEQMEGERSHSCRIPNGSEGTELGTLGWTRKGREVLARKGKGCQRILGI